MLDIMSTALLQERGQNQWFWQVKDETQISKSWSQPQTKNNYYFKYGVVSFQPSRLFNKRLNEDQTSQILI